MSITDHIKARFQNMPTSDEIFSKVSHRLSHTAKIRLFGITKIPLMFAIGPKVLHLDENACEVLVPLNYFTKNHLGSMYFGAQSIGADSVVGIFALYYAEKYPELNLAPIFKDFKADFLKRAEKDTVFVCKDGAKILAMIEKTKQTGERVTDAIEVIAHAKNDAADVFSKFTLGLSLKARK